MLEIAGDPGDPSAREFALLGATDGVPALLAEVKTVHPYSLAGIEVEDLVVYANNAVFADDPEQLHPLPVSHRLHGLALDEDDHLVVAVAHPRGFRWSELQPLVRATAPGAAWDFQDTAVDKRDVAKDLKTHFAAWRQESDSKYCHTVFVCCDGPGTGKSRLLDEFPAIVTTSLFARDDRYGAQDKRGRAILRELSQNVNTFKIAFDEPTPVRPVLAGRPDLMIGTRMLFQLHESTSQDAFLVNSRNHVTPSATLARLAAIVDKEQRKLCVIICVDDMHVLRHEKHSRTEFIAALDCLRALSNAPQALTTVLLATERLQAMMDFHDYTQQTLYLQSAILSVPTTVNGRSVFAEFAAGLKGDDGALFQLLIDDMGGHARALEVLAQVLHKHKNQAFAFIPILKAVLMALQDAFPAI